MPFIYATSGALTHHLLCWEVRKAQNIQVQGLHRHLSRI